MRMCASMSKSVSMSVYMCKFRKPALLTELAASDFFIFQKKKKKKRRKKKPGKLKTKQKEKKKAKIGVFARPMTLFEDSKFMAALMRRNNYEETVLFLIISLEWVEYCNYTYYLYVY